MSDAPTSIAYSVDGAEPKEENKPQIVRTINVLAAAVEEATAKVREAHPDWEIRAIRKVFQIDIP